MLNYEQVRSSIARRLGIEYAGMVHADRNFEGVVEMMLDATQRYNEPLDQERIFGWHAALFPKRYVTKQHHIRLSSKKWISFWIGLIGKQRLTEY